MTGRINTVFTLSLQKREVFSGMFLTVYHSKIFIDDLKFRVQRLRTQVYLRGSHWRATVDRNDRISGEGDIRYFIRHNSVSKLMKNTG